MIVEFVSSGLIFCNNYPADYTEVLTIHIRKRILIAALLYFTTITRALHYKTYAGIDFCVAVIAAHVPLRITRNAKRTTQLSSTRMSWSGNRRTIPNPIMPMVGVGCHEMGTVNQT